MSDAAQGPGWWQASDGKWYPPEPAQGPPRPQVQPAAQKKGGCLRRVGIAALVIVGLIAVAAILAALGGGGSSKPKATPGGGSQRVYALGQTAHTGAFDVTLDTVQNPYTPTNRFEAAPAGQHLVGVELTVRNTTNTQQPLSTLLGAEVTDSQSRPWSITIAGTDKPQLDGEVPANDSRRGWIFFKVDDSATGLKLRLKGNLTATGSLFDLGG